MENQLDSSKKSKSETHLFRLSHDQFGESSALLRFNELQSLLEVSLQDERMFPGSGNTLADDWFDEIEAARPKTEQYDVFIYLKGALVYSYSRGHDDPSQDNNNC